MDPAHLCRLRDAARLEALTATGLLDSEPEAEFDRLTRLAARFLHAPVALISLVDDHRQFFKSQLGLREPWASRRETPLSHSFCQYTLDGKALLVNDSRLHPLVRDNLAVSELGVIAYAGIPLVTCEQRALGALCVIDGKPRAWNEPDVDTLRELAAVVVTEIEFRIVARALRAEVRDRERFMAMVGHDLRQPLTSVTHASWLLSSQHPPSEAIGRTVRRLCESTRRMRRMVDDLLDFSRLQANVFPLKLEPSDLHELLRRVREEVGACYAGRTIELALEGSGEGWFDPERLAQVFGNLLTNALGYSPAPSTVQVRAISGDDVLRVEVHNRNLGPPLSADEQRQIFHPFRHGSQLPQTSRGLGLGLFIVDAIVKAHHGAVEVHSDAAGTTFAVCLPRARPA
jgi:signal transduction histidine kinase